MPVRVAQEELPGAVRPLLAREMFHAPATEVTLPGIEVIHAQGEVIAPMVGRDRLGFSLLKSAGVLPPELELLKEVETLKKALAKCRDERTRARTRHQIQTKRTMFAMALERRGKSARADRSLEPPVR